jgi:hypothetical protein
MTDEPLIDPEHPLEKYGRKPETDVDRFLFDLLDLAEKSIPDHRIICVIVREDGKTHGTVHNLDTSDQVPNILRRSADRMERR